MFFPSFPRPLFWQAVALVAIADAIADAIAAVDLVVDLVVVLVVVV